MVVNTVVTFLIALGVTGCSATTMNIIMEVIVVEWVILRFPRPVEVLFYYFKHYRCSCDLIIGKRSTVYNACVDDMVKLWSLGRSAQYLTRLVNSLYKLS